LLGVDHRFLIETPLMWTDKAATWQLAHNMGEASGATGGGQQLIDLIVKHTRTCHLPPATCHRSECEQRHAFGCGSCPARALLAKGWAGFL
jgi:7-cyano-7-deazaguanine synthase